ncbi:MAG: HDOD domain-containing protein [Verrucomicrobiota bacterium]
MIDLNQLIARANDLAPLPASAVRLAGVVSHPSCHLDDVADLIRFDQSLTLRLLRAANSAASASIMPVSEVSEAVGRMGMAQVLTLAVAWGAQPVLQARIAAYDLNEGDLWRHAVAAAVAAETLPNFCSVEVPPETFTAALLHDVGKLVMGRFLDAEDLQFIRRAEEVDHCSRLEAESILLSVNHGELGGLIAQHWKLPARVVQGIIYHSNPEPGGDVVCDLTYLANVIAKRIEAGLTGQAFGLSVNLGAIERLGLTPASLEVLYPVASQRYDQVSRRYNSP